jgi:hypothetical protein
MFQLAIWEMNPKFKKSDFTQEYLEDAISADAEHGSQFVDTQSTFFQPDEVASCIMKKPRLETGNPAIQYWLRLDPSRKNDRYSIAVGHKERIKAEPGSQDEHGERIHAFIDYIQYWEPRWFENVTGNEVAGGTWKDRRGCTRRVVDTQEVMTHIHELMDRFNIVGVTSDQFESQYIIEELNAMFGTKEHPFAEIRPITEKNNWLAYRNIKKMINNKTFHIYQEKAFIEEALVAMRFNKGKPLDVDVWSGDEDPEDIGKGPQLVYSVEAPRTGPIRTDDVLDSVVFDVWDMMMNPDLAPFTGGVAKGYGERELKVNELEKIAGFKSRSFSDTIPTEW